MTESIPFSQALKEARKAAGMSQQALADASRIPKRTIEAWEVQKRTPPEYVQYLVLDWIRNRNA